MKYSNVCVMMLLAISLVSCSNEAISTKEPLDDNRLVVDVVKNELIELNASYKPVQNSQKRMPKWLRWVVLSAADVAGAIYGGVGGACQASTFAWMITKDQLVTTDSQPTNIILNSDIFKEDNLQGIEVGSTGYLHNIVITSAFEKNQDLQRLSTEEIMSVIFQSLENETSTAISETEKNAIINSTNLIISSFNPNNGFEDFIDNVKEKTSNQDTKDALDICKIVLDGLQFVDDNDSLYVKSAIKIIKESSLNDSQKSILTDGISVANASAKLWKTNNTSHLNNN